MFMDNNNDNFFPDADPISDIDEKELKKDRGSEIRKTFRILGLGMVGFFLASTLSTLAISLLIDLLFTDLAPSNFLNMLFSMAPMYLFGLPAFLLITRKLKINKPETTELSFFKLLCCLAVSAAFMYVGNIVSNIFVTIFELIKGGGIINEVSDTLLGGEIWVNIIFIVILAPIFEELFFRRILCGKLLHYGELIAILVPSVIFAFCHGNFFQLFYAFLIGVVLSYIYVKTGKLRYTVFIHMLLNLLFGIVSSEITKLSYAIEERAGDNVFLQVLPTLINMAYIGIYLSIVALGVVAFFINLKNIRLDPIPADIKASSPVKNIFLNVGVILTLLYFTYTMLYSVLI